MPVTPRQLIRGVYKRLAAGSGLTAVAIAGVYMKMPVQTVGPKGQVICVVAGKQKKTSDESCTHGQMVSSFFHTRCQVRVRHHKGSERIYFDFDLEVRRFATLISEFWPPHLAMSWWPVFSSKDPRHSWLNVQTA